MWLNHYNFSIGVDAKSQLFDLCPQDQAVAIASIKSFVQTAVLKLQLYLPFQSKFLRCCRFVSPSFQRHPRLESWAVTLSKNLPRVIPKEDISSLELEVRHFQASDPIQASTIADHWKSIRDSGKYPKMVLLARALFSMPHANADVERLFSNLKDVVHHKRASLLPLTIKALTVSKSCLIAKEWNTQTLPADPTLLKLAADARANYEKRMKTVKDEEQEKKTKELEKRLAEEVAAAKAQNPKLKELCASAATAEQAIEKKLDEKRRAQTLLEDLQQKAKQADEDLEQLRKKKEQIQKRKNAQSAKVAEKVIKEHAKAFASKDDAPSFKRQKFSL